MEFYDRLTKVEKYRFQCHMRENLTKALAEDSEMHPARFLEHVVDSFRSSKPEETEKPPAADPPSPKPKKAKAMKQKAITEYQKFEKAQLKERHDEFKHMSAKDRQAAIGHTFYAMSRDEKEAIIAKTGRLSV